MPLSKKAEKNKNNLFKICYIYRSMSRFYCDYCKSNVAEPSGEIGFKYFSCYQLQDWNRHLKSKKHIKNEKKIVEAEEYCCPYCNKYFDKEGYENHLINNKDFHAKWNIYKEIEPNLSCNNWIYEGNKRATSYEDWREKLIGEPKKPKYVPTYTLEKSYSSSSSDYLSTSSEDEIPDEFCNECNLPIYEFLTNVKKKKLKNRGCLYCECEWEYCSNIVEI